MKEKEWRHGDDAAAARLILERHGITVTRWALARWRKSKAKKSPLSKIYAAALQEVAQNRNQNG